MGQSYDADIAIITLTTPIDSSIIPACLYPSTNNYSNIIGKEGTVIGWGLTEQNVVSLKRPNELNIKVVDNFECIKSNSLFKSVISNRTLCLGNNDGDGVCNGDSGSGLFFRENGKWYLMGLVSASLSLQVNDNENKPSCDVKNYSVFTDVTKYYDWIKDFIE